VDPIKNNNPLSCNDRFHLFTATARTMGRFRIMDDEDEDEPDEVLVDQQDGNSNNGRDWQLVRFAAADEQQQQAGEQEQETITTKSGDDLFHPSPQHYASTRSDDESLYVHEQHHHRDGRGIGSGYCSSSAWRRSMMVAAGLAILCHAYLPPAPPPPSDANATPRTAAEFGYEKRSSLLAEQVMITDLPTNEEDDDDATTMETLSWRLFLASHSRNILHSTKALTIDTPLHLLKWLGIGLYHDLQSTYHETLLLATSSSADYCSWQIPRSMDLVRRDLVAHGIRGQDVAVQLLAEALVGWHHHPTTNHNHRQPLSIFAVGLQSTGKTSLARAIAALYGGDDRNHNCPSVVLSIPPDDPRTIRQLRHRIQQHVHQYPHASLVLYHDNDDLAHELLRHPIENAEHAIFYRLSHTMVGGTLTRYLRRTTTTAAMSSDNNNNSGSGWGSPAMLADLRAELLLPAHHHHDEHELPVTTTTTILPFAPLTPMVLAAIVRHHLGPPPLLSEEEDDDNNNNDESISSSSVSSLLDNVEYMDWTTKDGELIMRVAIDGARSIPWNRIRALQATVARHHKHEAAKAVDTSSSSVLEEAQ
jgi:hypothetical protein